jgi:hypothetical protein
MYEFQRSVDDNVPWSRGRHTYLKPMYTTISTSTKPHAIMRTYTVVWLHIQQQRRDHAHGLLAGDVADLGLVDQEGLELAEGGLFAQDSFRDGELPG